MRKILPLLVLFAFFPIFAISAEKLSNSTPKASILAVSTNEISFSDPKLSQVFLNVRIPETGTDSNYSVDSNCRTDSKMLSDVSDSDSSRSKIFSVRFLSACETPEIWISKGGKKIQNVSATLKAVSKESLFVDLSDLSDDALFLFARDSRDRAIGFSNEAKTSLSKSESKPIPFSALTVSHKAAWSMFRSRQAYALFAERQNLRYVVPVSGSVIPEDFPFIPGGRRPYRKETTDGIHHGWDLMAPIGKPVRALAGGVVIRVVSGFVWKDFENLVKPPKEDDVRLTNLDIFRGNQVWLKTADGNVTFYSHLRDIAPGIKTGVSVVSGEILGTVGVSGVPDRQYANPHLHFEIQRNPRDGKGSNDPISIMRWSYFGKGLKKQETIDLSRATFR